MKRRISARKWLFLPIETKSRELHGKMLLACFAAARGWGVVIGGKAVTRDGAQYLPKGVFIEKSISPGRLKDIEALQGHGHRVTVCDEEGLLYVNLKWYEQRRLEKESFDLVDYFFAWGEQHKEDTISILKKGEEKIVVSGNPRFDVLRKEFRSIYAHTASHLRQKYGRIILVNSNFLFVNNGSPEASDYIAYLKSIGKITDEENENTWQSLIRFGKENMRHFLEMLPTLSREFPDHTIVIRPHPSEKDSTWIEGANGLPNVRVIFEHSANEWIMASDVSIQNNCTTAVEAFVLDKPAISYRPYKDDEIEFKLPNALSFQAHDLNGLVELLKELIDHPSTDRGDKLPLAKRHIENVGGFFASEVILDTLDKLPLKSEEGIFPIKTQSFGEGLKNKLKTVLGIEVDSYTRKKFPGITLPEVEEILSEYKKEHQSFNNISVIEAGKDGFCLFS